MSVSKHHLINQAKISKKSCNVGFKIDETCWTSADLFQTSVEKRRSLLTRASCSVRTTAYLSKSRRRFLKNKCGQVVLYKLYIKHDLLIYKLKYSWTSHNGRWVWCQRFSKPNGTSNGSRKSAPVDRS